MSEKDETGWLIERRPQTGSHPQYLMVCGSNADTEHSCEGRFEWTFNHIDALRFCRRRDAILVIGALRTLSDTLRHKETVSGLRTGDASPQVVEHRWSA